MIDGGGRQRRVAAAVLLIVTSVVWLHQWWPALLVLAFVLWVIVHHRLEGDFGDALLRWWHRMWPPSTLVLAPLLVAGIVAYWVSSVPIAAKLLPVALNLVALSMLCCGTWWKLFIRVEAVSASAAPGRASP